MINKEDYVKYLSEQSDTNSHYLNRLIKLLSHFVLNEPNIGESHHIIPKSWKPEWHHEKENRVLLSPKAHYVIHHLMWKAFPNDVKMTQAFWFMSAMRATVTARVYDIVKKEMAKNTSKRFKGVPKSELAKAKNSETHYRLHKLGLIKSTKGQKYNFTKAHRLSLSQNNPMKRDDVKEKWRQIIISQEYRDKLSAAQKERYADEREREKLSVRTSGSGNPMYGKKQERVVCSHCNKEVDRPNYTRWHGDKCKEKT